MEFIKDLKSTLYIMAGFYFVCGLILLIFPQATANAISYIVGALCIIIGGLAVYTYIGSEIYGPLAFAAFVIAIVFIGAGIAIIFNPETFTNTVPLIMGVMLVIESFTKMMSARTMKKYKLDEWWEVLAAALVVFILGIVLIVAPVASVKFMIRLIGLFLVLDAISSFITAINYSKIESKIK